MRNPIPRMMVKGRQGARAIADTSMGRGYNEAVSPAAGKAQDALVQLIGGDDPFADNLRGKATRMAASSGVLNALKATPALAAIYGTTLGADILGQAFSPEQESFANTGMDLLGMGGAAGAAYGLNRGINALGGTTRAGAALGIAAAAGLGKMGSDAVQGLVGM